MRAIITADWHIRATMPRCRIDADWMETQKKALRQILNISDKKKAPIFVVGDIFHSNSDTNFECVNMVQKLADIAGGLHIIAGNHDLPYHSSENIERSAVGILLNSNNVCLIAEYMDKLDEFSFSASNFDEQDNKNAEVVFKHVLVFPDDKSLPPSLDALTAADLLNEFPKAKWIFTGDYHHNFHYKKNGRHVVNPGCLLRQASDMKDYQCGVYFVDTDEEVVEFIPIIDNEQFVDDSYILKESERSERIESFVNKLKDTKSVSLDFKDNVYRAIKQNKFSDEMIATIEALLEV